ncbi:hypothetical protein SEA_NOTHINGSPECIAL_70 [Mycobacterium phage NothingSpecial]|nr:hypothetical protein SEA_NOTHINGSPECIAL_70 [Mycobacterium phage NothingSpecial]
MVPLTHLAKNFAGVVISEPQTVVHRPGWLFAQRCESWMDDAPSETCTTLLVYRSPLVTCTKPMYRPVAELILGADRMDVLGHGFLDDESMMHGTGEFLVARLYDEHVVFPPSAPSVGEMRAVIEEALTGGLVV